MESVTPDREKVPDDATIAISDSSCKGGIPDELDAPRSRRVLWKIDLVIMPVVTFGMTLAFLDENVLPYAAVYGLVDDTHLHNQLYSWLGSTFYFGYLFMEFPNLWIISKFPVGKYMGACFCAMGTCFSLLAACHSFAGLAALRFLQGAFEAAMLPCLLFINSAWYRREEQPLRTALWANTFAGTFTGILSYAIGNIGGPLSTWRYIFLIYGSATISMGLLMFIALPNSPSTAWFLTEEERRIAVRRVAMSQTEDASHNGMKWRQILEALRDPKYWCISTFFITQAITNAGITQFNPLIISGYGFSRAKTVLMATPQAAIAMVAQAILTAITFWVPNLRCVFWVLASCVAMAGAATVKVLDPVAHRHASLAGVYLMGFWNVPWVMVLSLQSSNVVGTTKKSFVSVSAAAFYAIGNIVGPHFFLEGQAPHYNLGMGAMLCCFAVMATTGGLYYGLCVLENKRRDREYGSPSLCTDEMSEMSQVVCGGLTDVSIHQFRYAY
ncbi:major facilitator superfamily transporter [Diplodia corticola]|uniref:Major facilitator superfamily transporter n=1 Tax=Diplodia corticola TaxID=236234 RepID=A0A1J9RXK5_9PEZI|nr:major facilitator superfamily transporter [Diplodia corticola]OJD32564.1 major facilitator superfamily transporter [Diplodia corticola]